MTALRPRRQALGPRIATRDQPEAVGSLAAEGSDEVGYACVR